MTNFIIICIFIQPWVFIPISNIADQFRLPQSVFLDFIFMGIITLYLIRGRALNYKNKYLAYLIGWLFLSFFFWFFIPFGLQFRETGRAINIWNMEPMIHIFLGLFATIAALSNLYKEDYIRIAKAITISATIVAGFSIMQFLRFDPLGSIARYSCDNRVSACLDNPNLVGNYLVLSIPLFFIFKSRLNKLYFSIVFLGVLCTNSIIAISLLFLGIWMSLLYMFRDKHLIRIIMISLLLVITILGCYYLHDKTYAQYNQISSGRLVVYEIALSKIKISPLIGLGLGAWRQNMPYISNTFWTVIHSDWIELWLGLGLIGILLILSVIYNSIRNLNINYIVNGCFLSTFILFLALMIFSFPLETATIAFPGLVSWWAIEHKEE